MMREIEFTELLNERWEQYHGENPVWTLDDLIGQLLRQHFDEADTMRESIKAQERRGR